MICVKIICPSPPLFYLLYCFTPVEKASLWPWWQPGWQGYRFNYKISKLALCKFASCDFLFSFKNHCWTTDFKSFLSVSQFFLVINCIQTWIDQFNQVTFFNTPVLSDCFCECTWVIGKGNCLLQMTCSENRSWPWVSWCHAVQVKQRLFSNWTD